VSADCKHDCATDRLGLSEDDQAMLSGYTWRAFQMLAHLREVWLAADRDNAAAIEKGLRAMMAGHSFADHPDLVAKVLAFSLHIDQAAELCRAAGPLVTSHFLAGLKRLR
jgi:hypothetical protein